MYKYLIFIYCLSLWMQDGHIYCFNASNDFRMIDSFKFNHYDDIVTMSCHECVVVGTKTVRGNKTTFICICSTISLSLSPSSLPPSPTSYLFISFSLILLLRVVLLDQIQMIFLTTQQYWSMSAHDWLEQMSFHQEQGTVWLVQSLYNPIRPYL